MSNDAPDKKSERERPENVEAALCAMVAKVAASADVWTVREYLVKLEHQLKRLGTERDELRALSEARLNNFNELFNKSLRIEASYHAEIERLKSVAMQAAIAVGKEREEVMRLKGVCGNHDANARLAQERAEKAEADLQKAFEAGALRCACGGEHCHKPEFASFADWQKSREGK